MLLRATHQSMSFLFAIIYRPPNSSHNQFLADLSNFLENISSTPSELVIMGDFNIHVDDHSDYFASSFQSLLDNFDLNQHINSPTHKHGHTLDLIITRNDSSILDSTIHEPFLSDHSAICCKFPATHVTYQTRTTKTYRQISSIIVDKLSADIYNSTLYSNLSCNLNEYSDQLSSALSSLLEKHAPLKTASCRTTPTKPFIAAESLYQKQIRSKLESAYRKTKHQRIKQVLKICLNLSQNWSLKQTGNFLEIFYKILYSLFE